MKYSGQLDVISRNILKLDKEDSKELTHLLTQDSLKNFFIYKNNYLQLAIASLSDDFIAVVKYLGEKNFNFFVRKMLLDQGIDSPNIIDLSRHFPNYLNEQFDIHKDEILFELAQIDLMWAHAHPAELTAFEGMLQFWQKIVTGINSCKEINLLHFETIKVIEIDGERVLKIIAPLQ